jgi:hypothetical protein
MKGQCELCGETYDQADPRPSRSEVAEFFDHERQHADPSKPFAGHVIAHAQCGIDAGLELA